MPLITKRPVLALVCVVVLVIGKPFAGPQVALADTCRGPVHRAHAADDAAARIETDILDQKIANRCGGSDGSALAPRGSRQQRDGGERYRTRCSPSPHNGNSSSKRNLKVLGSVSCVRPRR